MSDDLSSLAEDTMSALDDRIGEGFRREDFTLGAKIIERSLRIAIAQERERAVEQEREAIALFLDSHRPSQAQLDISPEYNDTAIKALEWAAVAIRARGTT